MNPVSRRFLRRRLYRYAEGRRHTFLAGGGTHFSGIFLVGSVEWHVFYGTDNKYWIGFGSILYRHDNRKIVMKLERVKLETVKIVTIWDFHAYFWRGRPPGYFDWGDMSPRPPAFDTHAHSAKTYLWGGTSIPVCGRGLSYVLANWSGQGQLKRQKISDRVVGIKRVSTWRSLSRGFHFDSIGGLGCSVRSLKINNCRGTWQRFPLNLFTIEIHRTWLNYDVIFEWPNRAFSKKVTMFKINACWAKEILVPDVV